MARKPKAAPAPHKARWFRVTGPRFDWRPTPRTMISFPHGTIGYRPQACIDAGLAAGVIEVIEKPEGARVGKDGQVNFGD